MKWNIFLDERREERRKRLKRSKVADVLWYSSVNDYRTLRFFLNFPIGFLISLIIYELAWKRLNFMENDSFYSFVFKWSLIALITIVRCATMCLCLSSVGRTGQGFFTVFVAEQVIDGSILNIAKNFEITASIISCNLELQSRITTQRITLATGPIEALMEKHLGRHILIRFYFIGRITTLGQKMIRTLKVLIEPFEDELNISNDEDETLAAVLDAAKAMSDREHLVEGENLYDINDKSTPLPEKVRPAWTHLKTKLGRATARRFLQRCEQIFASTVDKCHKRFQNAQKVCYDNTPFYISYFTCGRLNVLQICKASKMQELSEKYCKMGEHLEKDNPINPDLDNQMESLQNISQQINAQLRLNLHFQAIEEPENEKYTIIDQIKLQISSDIDYIQAVFEIVKDIFTGLLICLIFYFFNRSLGTILKFLWDLEFQNNFITPEFWFLDEKRRMKKRSFLGELTEDELKMHNLLTLCSWPSLKEIAKDWLPFTRWFYLCFFSLTFVLVDHVLYKVLLYTVKYGNTHSLQQGHHILDINVEGDGPYAEIIKDILNFNYSTSLSQNLTNEMCFKQPNPPDWPRIWLLVILPLTSMLLFQVLFNHFISRATLFYVIGYVFRKRKKTRTIYLYNKILSHRQQIYKRANMKV